MRPLSKPLFLCFKEKIKPSIKNITIDSEVIQISAALLDKELLFFKIAKIKEIIIPNRIVIIKDILKLNKVFFISFT